IPPRPPISLHGRIIFRTSHQPLRLRPASLAFQRAASVAPVSGVRYCDHMADENRFRRFVKDKAVLLILAVVLVVPVAAYLAFARQAPVIAESGSDLKALPADEKHVVTRRLKDTDLEALER